MNIANKLTFLRILLIPVMTVLYFLKLPLYAAVVFVLAVITDFLDGYIARKQHIVTDFGKFLDPIADKMLNITALLLLLLSGSADAAGIILAVCTIIIVAREFTITGFRIIAANKKVVIAADNLGKIKTITQDVAVLALLLWQLPAFSGTVRIDIIILVISAVLTVVSGCNYIIKNRQVFNGD